MPDLVHGAVSPDRLMVTPEGRVIVVEPVLGSAIEHLRYSRQHYWRNWASRSPSRSMSQSTRARTSFRFGGRAGARAGKTAKPDDRFDQIPPAVIDFSRFRSAFG